MKINHKIKIDLLDFIKTGKFDHLKLGMSKEEVLRVFPEPEYWGTEKKYRLDPVWLYGNFELHFQDENLFMIFNDYVDSLDGGLILEIDPWIFKPDQKIRISDFINSLIAEKIDFTKTTNIVDQVILSGIGTDIQITFDRTENQDEELMKIEDREKYKAAQKNLDPTQFELVAFCKIDRA